MVFLQATPTVVEGGQSLQSTVNQLTESSISLAEAAANFGALKVMFGVFLVFVSIMLLFFVYQMLTYNKKLSDIHTSSLKIEKYLDGASNRSIGSAEANVLIRREFNNLSQAVKYNILRCRLENHLDRTEDVNLKVSRLISYEYAELKAFLNNFNCDERELGDMISDADVQVIKEFMLEQIYLEKSVFSVSTMDHATDILINGVKLASLKKI